MAKKGSSKSRQAAYQAYELQGKGNKNKQRKLERHIKAHPEDFQATEALKSGVSISGAKKRLGKRHSAVERLMQVIEKRCKRSITLIKFDNPKNKTKKKGG